MILAAFDPGLSGAVAIFARDGGGRETLQAVHDFPVVGVGRQVLINGSALTDILDKAGVDAAVVELVGAMPGQGVSSMFKFGTAYGQIIGIIQCLCIPWSSAPPQKWKREMGVPGGKAKAEAARARATALYPAHAAALARKKDHNRAEAILLGRWWLGANKPMSEGKGSSPRRTSKRK